MKNIKTYQEIKDALVQVLDSNDVKPGTKLARSIECSFLQGMMFTEPRFVNERPLLPICLLSGRSLLDMGFIKEETNTVN